MKILRHLINLGDPMDIDRRKHRGPFRFLYMELRVFLMRLLGRD